METLKPNSHSWWLDSHISPEGCKWLAENIEVVDQSVKQMLKLIKEDENSSANKFEIYYQKRPELIAHVEEFCRMHRLLAERYDHLTGELRKNFPSLPQMQHPEISDSGSYHASLLLTPNQNMGPHKSEQPIGFDLLLSSGGGSSDISLKEGSEFSSSISSDSDSESFNSSINKHSVPSVDGEGKRLHVKFELESELLGKEEKVQLTNQENVNGALKVRETGGYEQLLRRIAEYEEELRVSSKKLQFSEEEIFRLKGELKKNESVILLAGSLQAQLDSAQRDIEMREDSLEMEKQKVLELQKQVIELETRIFDSDCEIGTLGEELKMAREKLRASEEGIGKLRHEISNKISEGTHQLQGQLELTRRDIALLETKLDSEKSQVLELEEKILRYAADVSDRDDKIRDLNAALHNAQEMFFLEKSQLQFDISGLLEQKNLLEARIGKWELQSKSLENEIEKCRAEKLEMKGLHEAQEINWKADISQLKAELEEKHELVECLNKSLDILKLKHDVLMAEKNGVDAKVEELQKEVDKQRAVISDRAEEKREAIRQLCFSLEHYRSGYQELREAYIGHKRRPVLAS